MTVKSKIGNAKLRAEGCARDAKIERRRRRKDRKKEGVRSFPKIYSNLRIVILVITLRRY